MRTEPEGASARLSEPSDGRVGGSRPRPIRGPAAASRKAASPLGFAMLCASTGVRLDRVAWYGGLSLVALGRGLSSLLIACL